MSIFTAAGTNSSLSLSSEEDLILLTAETEIGENLIATLGRRKWWRLVGGFSGSRGSRGSRGSLRDEVEDERDAIEEERKFLDAWDWYCEEAELALVFVFDNDVKELRVELEELLMHEKELK